MPSFHVMWHTATEAFLSFSSRQKLVLVDIKSIPIKAPDAQLQNQGSLRYHFPEGLLQMPVPLIRVKNADVQVVQAYFSHFFHYLWCLLVIWPVNSSENYLRHGTFQLSVFSSQLKETLQQLVQSNEEGGTTEASVKFLQMVQLLRVVTLEEIESVWVQFASEPPYR